MKVTCNHPASKYGVPVILDDYGNPYHYQPGIESALEVLGWSKTRAAREAGFGSEEGVQWVLSMKKPSIPLLNVIGAALERLEQEKARSSK